jgi:hypothetical protein
MKSIFDFPPDRPHGLRHCPGAARNADGCGDGTCEHPDDEAWRQAGTIKLGLIGRRRARR